MNNADYIISRMRESNITYIVYSYAEYTVQPIKSIIDKNPQKTSRK